MDKLWACLKKKWWYLILLILSSVYVFCHWHEIDQLSQLTVQTLIFILWIVLLVLPLFSEIEIGGVKLKREIERARSETKEAINELRMQVMDLKVSNSNTFVFNPPLASKGGLEDLEKNRPDIPNDIPKENLFRDIPDDAVYLFQVRLVLENLISALCEKFQYSGRKSLLSMIHFLLRCELIDNNIAGLLQETIKIANCGVHGEILSNDYITFVKKVFPDVKYTLEQANQRYNGKAFFICPRCHYAGPSTSNSICPQCGYVSDDD